MSGPARARAPLFTVFSATSPLSCSPSPPSSIRRHRHHQHRSPHVHQSLPVRPPRPFSTPSKDGSPLPLRLPPVTTARLFVSASLSGTTMQRVDTCASLLSA